MFRQYKLNACVIYDTMQIEGGCISVCCHLKLERIVVMLISTEVLVVFEAIPHFEVRL